MTGLETYTALTALWLGVSWLPYILDRLMVRGVIGAMANYSPDARAQSPWAQRAKRAHTVHVESFVAFAPLAILAIIKNPADAYAGTLATLYFWALLAHYIIYLIGIPVARTLAFAVAAFCTVLMGLHSLGIT